MLGCELVGLLLGPDVKGVSDGLALVGFLGFLVGAFLGFAGAFLGFAVALLGVPVVGEVVVRRFGFPNNQISLFAGAPTKTDFPS